MSGVRRALASEAWLLEQQVRAEMEAEAWRRLREEITRPLEVPAPIPDVPSPPPPLPERIQRGGSSILKALVRFALAAFGAYLAYLAAYDGGLGEFEIWLAVGAGFLVTLSLSMLGPARHFVHTMAEATRWALIAALAIGAVWLLMKMSA